MAIEDIKTDIKFLDENNEYVKGAFNNNRIESLEIANIKSNYRLHEILTNLAEKSWIDTLKSFRITNSKIKKTGFQALVDHLPTQLHILTLFSNI
ncbi:MAG: hypothetical protein Q4E61_03670 [Alphaproteobacteria bacterium]|nr:hypothetical protein [Alphaproteobacteria bacterium]